MVESGAADIVELAEADMVKPAAARSKSPRPMWSNRGRRGAGAWPVGVELESTGMQPGSSLRGQMRHRTDSALVKLGIGQT